MGIGMGMGADGDSRASKGRFIIYYEYFYYSTGNAIPTLHY